MLHGGRSRRPAGRSHWSNVGSEQAAWRDVVDVRPRKAQSANASGGGHEQTRLRSPYAPSIRRTGGQYLARGSTPAGKVASSREYACPHLPAMDNAVCGAFRSGLSWAGQVPAATWSISPRMAIIAAQNRSSSARSSLSVGSTIRVPATGKDIVGAWKP